MLALSKHLYKLKPRIIAQLYVVHRTGSDGVVKERKAKPHWGKTQLAFTACSLGFPCASRNTHNSLSLSLTLSLSQPAGVCIFGNFKVDGSQNIHG